MSKGRKVFGNIIKYIRMGCELQFRKCAQHAGREQYPSFSSAKPIQMLTQNLLYDVSQVGIPLDHVDEEYLLKPRRWEIGGIARFMLFMGPVSSVFDYATFALMWFYFKANNPGVQSLFQTGWFVEGLLSQTLIVHMIRTRKIPFVQSRASVALLLTTASVMRSVPICRSRGLGKTLGFVHLPSSYFPWLVVFLLSYCLLTQVVKGAFIRRYGYG